MMGKRTVPFRTRLQMYPRREHLVLILWVPFSFVLLVMDASVTSAVFLGLACALAMWVAIPDFNRYRMFGVPVSSWIMDTAIAVHVVALVYIAVWTSAGFGPLSFLGIVLADAGVLLWALFTHSPLTRGDQRVRARAANGWDLISRLPGVPGPTPWRLVYAPVVGAAIMLVLIAGLVILPIMMLFGGVESLSGATPLVAPVVILLVTTMGGSFRGWRAIGLPARRWLLHAYLATSSLMTVFVVGALVLSGTAGYPATAAQAAVFWIVGLAVAAATVSGSMGRSFFVLVIGVTVAIGVAVPIGASMDDVSALLTCGLLLILCTVGIARTYRRVTAGNQLRSHSPLDERHRTYYQLKGAAS